ERRYDEAIAMTREFLRLSQLDHTAEPWRPGEAAAILADLEHVAALPDSMQRKLARSDSLGRVLDSGVHPNETGGSALAEERLALATVVLGPASRDIMTIESQAGAYRFYDGQYDASERHMRRALDLSRQLLEPDHPAIALSESNLSVPLVMQGKLATAE